MGSLVGTKVGRFRVDRELGRGGMGAVYAAFDERLEREVALKVLLASNSSDDDQRRFIREARLAAKLTHPNIASIYEVDQIDGRIVIIMELLEGESLRKILSTRRLSVEDSVSIARDVARALARAHASGIIHRDIKPENVFVTEPAPGALHAKVLDFGLARQKDPAMMMKGGDGNESTMSQTWGTPGYMSPEQANRESVDPRTDIFAFGALFYEMLAGIRAFRAANELGVLAAVLRSEPRALTQIVPDLPPPIDGLVLRCLKKARDDRYADGKELSAALESFARASRGSSPDLGSRPSIPNAVPSAPSSVPQPIESTPSNASVTTTKDPPTRKPLGLDALPIDLRDPNIQKRAAIVLAFGGMFVIGLLLIIVSRSGSSPPTATTTTAPSQPVTADPDPFVVPPPPPVAAEAESAAPSSVDVDDAPPSASSQAAAPIPVRTAKPKNKAADCKTPFIIDSKGVKIPKMHCLQ